MLRWYTALAGYPDSMNTSARLERDLRMALDMADAADQLTLSRFRAADLSVETKPDMTLVSDADKAAEELLRERIEEYWPGDKVLGEEQGGTTDAERLWVLDPIDGTHNFVRGVPVWATLIGLVEDGQVVAGVVSAPTLGRRWWAASGHGAYCGGSLASRTKLRVSRVGEVKDASFSYSSLGGWGPRRNAMRGLMDECWRTRAYGDFWSYMLVAEGAVDIAAEPELALYDMAALVPVVEEAGGRFTSLEGAPGPWGGNAVATNGLLHAEVLAALKE
ncbi:histidinol-phosphatase [Actinomycetaceae bacterium WB03_NA08]|uniref:Histidinol-phosphatase n=2 Tax=Scrofimicrobium canadense TaxID=2652290 RepID=A0A6N7W5R0_9ACTO|nr:histidinol-phosphatase [Scrofimicrobium canadense]